MQWNGRTFQQNANQNDLKCFHSWCSWRMGSKSKLLDISLQINMPWIYWTYLKFTDVWSQTQKAIHHPVASNGEEVSSYGKSVEEISLTFIMLMKFSGHLKQAAQRQYDVYNATMLIHKYTTGDVVWLFNEKLGNKCPKFKQAYVGPCIVTETFSDLVFKI